VLSVSSSPTEGSRPSPGHLLEMAHSVANDAIRTVAMQCSRVLANLPDDETFFGARGFRKEIALNFMLVALRRLRRAATLVAGVEGCQESLRKSIQQFDEALPSLPTMRNVGEHIDEYILGGAKRRHRDVYASSVGVRLWFTCETGALVFDWVGQQINIDEALGAAEDLYSAILDTVRSWRPQAPS